MLSLFVLGDGLLYSISIWGSGSGVDGFSGDTILLIIGVSNLTEIGLDGVMDFGVSSFGGSGDYIIGESGKTSS